MDLAGWGSSRRWTRSELACGEEGRLSEQPEKGLDQCMLPVLPVWEEDVWKGGKDGENSIGRKEARFHRGLNPTQSSLGFSQ